MTERGVNDDWDEQISVYQRKSAVKGFAVAVVFVSTDYQLLLSFVSFVVKAISLPPSGIKM